MESGLQRPLPTRRAAGGDSGETGVITLLLTRVPHKDSIAVWEDYQESDIRAPGAEVDSLEPEKPYVWSPSAQLPLSQVHAGDLWVQRDLWVLRNRRI